MNERIRKLVAQAEDYASEHEEHWHDGPDWQELFNEKFAELIVKECMNICEHKGDAGLDGHYCADEIKKQFGIQ
jgi:hypothetical protein